VFDQARYTRKRACRDRRKEGRQIVRAIARATTIPDGPHSFNIKYWTRCKIYAAEDVSYAPDLTLPVVKLSELTRGGGPWRPSAMPGPFEAIKRRLGKKAEVATTKTNVSKRT
jgi:hypothetical protein